MQPETLNVLLCDYIREQLRGKKLNAEARDIGVPQSNLYRIVKGGENPDISMTTAEKYAKYFKKKSLAELLTEIGKK